MNPRKYGRPPYQTVVIHGGPGAPGYMAPVARELARDTGVLEPLQTKDSLDGQVRELHSQLTAHADLPATLIGSSWGAVLALLITARYNTLVDKLILIGSAVFDRESSAGIERRRMERLGETERQRIAVLQDEMKKASDEKRRKLFSEWGGILSSADTYDELPDELQAGDALAPQPEIFQKVWPKFEKLRDTPGALKHEFSQITIPTVVIHGEYDPHPIDGIRPLLEDCIGNLRFYILTDCGHYPWRERHAKNKFYQIIREVM